jgi:hypothetical protein
MFKESNRLKEDSMTAKKGAGELLNKDNSDKHEVILKATENFYNLKSNNGRYPKS